MTDKEEKTVVDAIMIAISVIITPPAIAIRGAVVKVLWNWFMVPIGLPRIGVIAALGISLTAALITYRGLAIKGKEKSNLETVLESIFMSILCLGLGAVYHFFQ